MKNPSGWFALVSDITQCVQILFNTHMN